ncbi:MAG: DegV family protein [Dehalococcoidia bacterium]
MAPVSLIVDTTADIPSEIARELGIIVVPARNAFPDRNFRDDELTPPQFYVRMRETAGPISPFGVPQAEYDRAFRTALASGGSVLCLVTPFDVGASLSTARASLAALQDQDIKVLNPGVASAGLCSLAVVLGSHALAGATKDELLADVDDLEPLCDTIFVPGDTLWLRRANRLAAIEQKLGPADNRLPVLRVSTRFTGLALADTFDEALARAADIAGQRAGKDRPLVVTVDHAVAPDRAEQAAVLMAERWNVARTIITELSPTIGSQIGPGAVGIGVAPLTGSVQGGR